MNRPHGPATDEKRLFVPDILNSRVLIWNSIPTKNNTPADIVLGQPNFTSSTANNGGRSASTLQSPNGVLIYKGKLFIADNTNCRVLIFNSLPTTNGASANVVVGQTDFTSANNSLTSSGLSCSSGIGT